MSGELERLRALSEAELDGVRKLLALDANCVLDEAAVIAGRRLLITVRDLLARDSAEADPELADETNEAWLTVERAIWPDGPAHGRGSGAYAGLKARIVKAFLRERELVSLRTRDSAGAGLDVAQALLVAVENAAIEALLMAEDGSEEPEWQTRLWAAADTASAALAAARQPVEGSEK